MTNEDFMELMRRTMSEDEFEEATAAVVILYRINGDEVGARCRGFFDLDNVEVMIVVGQEILEDLRDMKLAKGENLQ